MFWHNILAYSEIFGTLCNHGILRALAYLEPEVYLEPYQRSTMKRFAKIVNGYSYVRKFQFLLRY